MLIEDGKDETTPPFSSSGIDGRKLSRERLRQARSVKGVAAGAKGEQAMEGADTETGTQRQWVWELASDTFHKKLIVDRLAPGHQSKCRSSDVSLHSSSSGNGNAQRGFSRPECSLAPESADGVSLRPPSLQHEISYAGGDAASDTGAGDLCSPIRLRPEQRRRPSVLIVDDAHVNRMVLSRMLEGLDVAVSTANDGLEAVLACKSAVFSAVLMDLHMVSSRVSTGLNAKSWAILRHTVCGIRVGVDTRGLRLDRFIPFQVSAVAQDNYVYHTEGVRFLFATVYPTMLGGPGALRKVSGHGEG